MNDSQVFYLKYRPQNLTEIIGQTKVKQNLSDAFKNDRLSHAYLFVGPRGTGKTSMARILAKMVNCVEKDTPCNKCASCLSITDGSNLDLIEIDAASNRGIEDIRLLREKIKLAPTLAKKKVYIIDEVHMLTSEAFNALLKTLEEPPKHVLFILATTDAGKIPSTILSRVQRLDFSLASAGELKQAFERIIKSEKIDIEEEGLELLIKKADGSFRDGVKFLDQLASRGGKIKTKDILDSFKTLDFESILNFVEYLKDRKTTKALEAIQKMTEVGSDMKEANLSLMDIFRKIMLIKNGLGETLVKPAFTADKYEMLSKLTQNFENEAIISNLNILQNALEKLKFAGVQSLPLELAVLEICGEKVLERAVKSETLEVVPVEHTIEVEIPVQSPGVHQIYSEGSVSSVNTLPSDELPSDNSDIAKIKEKWTYVCETIRPYNFSLEALLRSVRVSECTDSVVVMEVPYSFHQRILEAPKNRDLLEGVLSEVLGRQMKVSCVLGTRPIKKEEVSNIEVAEDDEIIRVAAEIFNSDSVN